MRQIAVCISCGGNQTFTFGFLKEILRKEGKIIYASSCKQLQKPRAMESKILASRARKSQKKLELRMKCHEAIKNGTLEIDCVHRP